MSSDLSKVLSCLVILCLLTTSCAGWRKLEPPYDVKTGDKIKLKDSAGKVREFKVTELSSDEISGQSDRIKRDEITVLWIRKFSKKNTAIAAAAVVSTLFFIAVLTASEWVLIPQAP
jgi:hypothetical protein